MSHNRIRLPTDRRVRGTVILPADAPARTAPVLVEVRDVTSMDGPAPVVGSIVLANVPIRPGGRCAFELFTPDMELSVSLSLRCHIDISGTGVIDTGDLLSTRSIPVDSAGDVEGLVVPVVLI
ncbi:hypothetical protein [Nocardia bovistercoris]|uniref:Uncharacterized protein n=1 Tax=Nocardia bovistercoris TaxID=2785916 RepID=A0A931IIC0_9NOCA|nr:hypothetical protein [Nocardia bovistercoris]MBH0780886.1 hypothetical protein [Nocardia bovistercoris]